VSVSDEAFWDWNAAVDELYLSPRFLEMFDFPPDTKFQGRAAFITRMPISTADREALEHAPASTSPGKPSDGDRISCFSARRGPMDPGYRPCDVR